jgi:NUDIX domain.
VSAAGHVDGGRTYEQAAALELAEELGVHDAELKEIAHYYADDPLWGGVQARRFAKIFEIKLDALPTRLGRAEVSKVRWFTKEELAELAAREPDKMGRGFALRRALPAEHAMKITAITQQVKRTDRYSIFVDGKYAFSLSESGLLASGLAVGQELTPAELKKLKKMPEWTKRTTTRFAM